MNLKDLINGKDYRHKDGRIGTLIGSHPHDGALLVFNEVDNKDDDGFVFYACEACDLVEEVKR